MSKKTKWHIRLGESEWLRYTYTRNEGDELKLLGSVRKGPQVGALGVNTRGDYLQVVGDYEVALNRSQIDKVLAGLSRAPNRFTRALQTPAAAPVVVVKRRRIAVPA